jgi:hypothetical protein
LEIDHFKAVNHAYGHLAVDAVLAAIAAAAKTLLQGGTHGLTFRPVGRCPLRGFVTGLALGVRRGRHRQLGRHIPQQPYRCGRGERRCAQLHECLQITGHVELPIQADPAGKAG